MSDYTPIFKLDLAGWLMQRKFVLLYCKRNEYNRFKIVYYFRTTESLLNAIAEYNDCKK